MKDARKTREEKQFQGENKTDFSKPPYLLIQPLIIAGFGPPAALGSLPFQGKSDDLWRERQGQGEQDTNDLLQSF